MKYKNMPCAWCGDTYYDGAHVPTRFLIPKEDRTMLKGRWPVLPSCKRCNQELKLDEEWFTIHFCSILYEFSENAKKMFDGPISTHLRSRPGVAQRYTNYLELKELIVDGVSMGIKTQVKLSKDDWARLTKVAEMFARGLYYWHSGKSAKSLKAQKVYLNPKRFEMLGKHMSGLLGVSLFPEIFEYTYGIVSETGEASFYMFIYGKPSYMINLVTAERYKEGEDDVKSGRIKPNEELVVEILG